MAAQRPGSHERTVRDLQAERASALARVAERLEAALAALAAAEAEADARPSAGAETARRRAVAHAGERLWCLVVQREAMGLTRHEVLDEVLRIPPAVRAAMGPPRRAG